MNESTSIETATGPANPKRKRRAATPRSPRNIDPGIAAIRKEATEKVKAYRKEKSGDRILRVIVEKRLPQLSVGQRQGLFDILSKVCTPSFIPQP